MNIVAVGRREGGGLRSARRVKTPRWKASPDTPTAWGAEGQVAHRFGFDPNPPAPFQIVGVPLP